MLDMRPNLGYSPLMRMMNANVIRRWAEKNGGVDAGAIALKNATRLSLRTCLKMASGDYRSAPVQMVRDAICELVGRPEDEVFPEAETRQSAG